MKINSFNRESCRIVSDKVEAALQAVANEFGVQIKTKGGTYASDGTSFNLKLEMSVIVDGKAVSPAVSDFNRYKDVLEFGFDLGEQFVSYDGVAYVVSGYKPRAQKYPVLAKSMANGKTYKFTLKEVQSRLSNKKQPL